MTPTTPLWLSIATAAIALLSALFTILTVRATLKAAERRSRAEAEDAMERVREQARLSQGELEREATRRLQEHTLFLYAQQRREAYVEFLTATSAYTRTVTAPRADDQATQTDGELAQANDALWEARSKIGLLGPVEVVAAAETYSKLLTRQLRRSGSVSNDEQKRLRDAFIEAARTDLTHATGGQ